MVRTLPATPPKITGRRPAQVHRGISVLEHRMAAQLRGAVHIWAAASHPTAMTSQPRSMPRRCDVDPSLTHLIQAQDMVVSRQQALRAGLTMDALRHRVRSGHWQVVLPGIYLCHPGEPARRQRLMAALLYCGPDAAIDAADACRFHGIKGVAVDDRFIHVAVPLDSPARTTGWVVVRRARNFRVVRTEMLRYVDPATAVIAAARQARSSRAALAVVSEAAQRRIASPDELLTAHLLGPRRSARLVDAAIEQIRGGARSVPEAEFRTLAVAMPTLPRLLYNRLLLMPDGRRISPDALAPDAPLIHETNGRVAHEREDLFEDMQIRHDYFTTWGFTALHNTPRRIYRDGRSVISEFERCYVRLAGTGWPEGVVLLDDAK